MKQENPKGRGGALEALAFLYSININSFVHSLLNASPFDTQQ